MGRIDCLMPQQIKIALFLLRSIDKKDCQMPQHFCGIKYQFITNINIYYIEHTNGLFSCHHLIKIKRIWKVGLIKIMNNDFKNWSSKSSARVKPLQYEKYDWYIYK